MKYKMRKHKSSLIFAVVVVITTITAVYIFNENSDFQYFILGMFFASVIFFIFMYVNQRKNLTQIKKILKNINCNSSLSVEFSEIIDSENNIYLKEISDFIYKIKQLLKRQKNFSEDAAHELKTPLTILRGELELALRESKNVDEYQQILSSALDEVNRLIRILQSVLEITKAESGKISLTIKENNLSDILNNLVDDAKILAEEKQIKINSDIQKNLIAEVDDLRIHQALLNLIENAIKYTGRNGTIDISLYAAPDSIVFKIKDTGIGIPKDKQKYIFERFFQIKDNPDAKNGVGIGLSIVKWIVDNHNGSIEVNSEINKGTEFILKIPKAKQENN